MMPPYAECPNGAACAYFTCAWCELIYGTPEPLTPADAPTPLDSEPPLGNCPNCWMPDDVSFRGFVNGSQAQFYCDNCGYGWIEEAQL